MKFGRVDNPELLDLRLPEDHKETAVILTKNEKPFKPNIYIGCAKWNKQDLKNFYPRGTKDELTYYSRQFNCIELNAFFYGIFPPSVVEKWVDKTPDNFKFFPKVPQMISQFKRLKGVERLLEEYIHSVEHFKEKLGMCFLQMHPSFSPKEFQAVEDFLNIWPEHIPLSVEFRHTDWYNDESVANRLYHLLESKNVSNTITDTAGRRDLIHMRLTTPTCFVRYTGANHESDYSRLNDWFERLKTWIELGIENIYFFVHQNMELASPLLSAHIIRQLNNELGFQLKIPEVLNEQKLF